MLRSLALLILCQSTDDGRPQPDRAGPAGLERAQPGAARRGARQWSVLVTALPALRALLPLAATLLAFEAGLRAQRRLRGAALANPVPIAVVLIWAVLTATGISPPDNLDGVARAMVMKSVTAAVAIAVASQISNDPFLAAGIVVLTGSAGAAMCTTVLDWSDVHDERARSLAIGTVTSGLGPARLRAAAPRAGAFSSLAGLLGGVLLPTCLAHWTK